MTRRKVVLFAIASLLLIWVIWLQISKPKQPSLVKDITIPVVVAKHDIPPYTILSLEDVRTAQLPPSLAANSFGGLSELVGLMTTTEVRAGNVIDRSRVLMPDSTWREGEMLIFSFYVPTARILGGQLRPGHHIDLLVTRAETTDQPPQSLWLARNLWVVGVYQASGEEVERPTQVPQEATPQAQTGTGGGALSFSTSATTRSRQGAANLVVMAAPRATAKMIGDYLGARLYEPWVYVRPGQTSVELPTLLGRIDGFVFEDANKNRLQERDEPGIDDVTVTLYDEKGVAKDAAQTVSGGTFYFDGLETGTYYVEETDPEGYVSLTPNRLRAEVVGGQNLHIVFGDMKPAPQPTPESTATVSAPTPTRQPPTPVPTATATPTQYGRTESGAVPTKLCDCSLQMSDRENGPQVRSFSQDDEVWAVVSFQDCPENMAYTVRSTFAETGDQERMNGVSTWAGGSGTVSIKVTPWLADRFEPGGYTTYLRLGPERLGCDYKWWSVRGEANETSEIEFPDGYPVTGLVSGRGR